MVELAQWQLDVNWYNERQTDSNAGTLSLKKQLHIFKFLRNLSYFGFFQPFSESTFACYKSRIPNYWIQFCQNVT